MALIKCIECGKEVSDKAKMCPHCGFLVSLSVKQYKEDEEKVKLEEDLIKENLLQDNTKQIKDTSPPYSWGLSVIFIIMGFMALNKSFMASVFFFIATAIMLPPIRAFVYQKIQQKLSEGVRFFLIAVCLIYGVQLLSKAEKMATIQEEDNQYQNKVKTDTLNFKQNKENILKLIVSHTKTTEFLKGKILCHKYIELFPHDAELLKVCHDNDKKFKEQRTKQKQTEENELKESMGSQAWKLHKKYPNWSIEECKDIAEGKYWIGMSYDMLISSFGRKPDSANPSNYGNGARWQWCWHNSTPSCFYDHNDDGIIDSYN
jgi:DNA-directed RNA polymerase subunit RPC12/RpoP